MKHYRVWLIITLKGTDLWAVTAYTTIVEDMGIKSLKKIERRDCWLLSIEAENLDEALKKAEQISSKKIFVNPNKHRYNILPEEEKEFAPKKEDGNWCINVLISSKKEDEEEILKTLSERFNYKEVKEVKKYTMWSLFIESVTLKEAREIAKNIIILKNRKEGLLANPFSQKFKIL